MIFWKDFVFDEQLGAILDLNGKKSIKNNFNTKEKKVRLSNDELINNEDQLLNNNKTEPKENE